MYRPNSRGGPDDPAIQPPQVLRAPEIVTVRERQVARLDVKLAGRPYPTVEWLKEDRVIRDSAKHKILVSNDGVHSLLINMVQADDQGTYTCVARNPGGEAKLVVTLSVQANQKTSAPQFVEKFQSVVIEPGQSLPLKCKAAGNPPPQLAWMRDQNILQPGQPYKLVNI